MATSAGPRAVTARTDCADAQATWNPSSSGSIPVRSATLFAGVMLGDGYMTFRRRNAVARPGAVRAVTAPLSSAYRNW